MAESLWQNVEKMKFTFFLKSVETLAALNKDIAEIERMSKALSL